MDQQSRMGARGVCRSSEQPWDRILLVSYGTWTQSEQAQRPNRHDPSGRGKQRSAGVNRRRTCIGAGIDKERRRGTQGEVVLQDDHTSQCHSSPASRCNPDNGRCGARLLHLVSKFAHPKPRGQCKAPRRGTIRSTNACTVAPDPYDDPRGFVL
jgi:hypothetical protein